MNNPKLTIILPSLNVGDYIAECLQSACDQTLKDIEIICVDAGSTDGTLEVIEAFAAKDARVKLIRSDRKSYGYQVNLGLAEAAGAYVAILETDDYVKPNMYERLTTLADETGVDYVKGEFDQISKDETGAIKATPISMMTDPSMYGRVLDSDDLAKLYEEDHCIWKGVYRRTFLKENHIRLNESEGAAYQDIGFSAQVLSMAQSAYYITEPLYEYRIGREGASTRNTQTYWFVEQEAAWLKAQGILEKASPIHQKAMQEYMENAYAYEKKLSTLNSWFLELSQKKGMQIVVFGAGVRGEDFALRAKSWGINISCFIDNSPELQETKKLGLDVISLSACMEKYPDALYVIANKNHAEEIKKQLAKAGIDQPRVQEYLP